MFKDAKDYDVKLHTTGLSHSEETRKLISEAARSRKANNRLGKTHSEESRARISEGVSRAMKGRKFTDEHKEALSASMKSALTDEVVARRIEARRQKLSVTVVTDTGETYTNFLKDIAKQLNIHEGTLKYRIKIGRYQKL